VIDKLFAGALDAVGAFFQCHEGRISDEDSGVCAIKHCVEIGSHGSKRHLRISPFVKEDTRVGDGGAACCIGCDAAQSRERLGSAADQ